jgi:phosphoribosylglycinamide formyltransferase-1
MKNIIVIASGSGTNAEKIINYFHSSNFAKVSHIVSNKADAYVLKRAELLNVNALFFQKKDFYESNKVLDFLMSETPDLIVLSGFLLLLPSNIVSVFPKRIVNIHPALLPKYGGKGMYGDNVHKAVIENHELESGITIHYVNEKYDEGDIIFQKSCPVFSDDTVSSLASRIHLLEYEYFSKVIEEILTHKK